MCVCMGLLGSRWCGSRMSTTREPFPAPPEPGRRSSTATGCFVGGTAPYFHDGRYASLRSLLIDADGKMGKTRHLSKDDLDALEAYMRSL